MKYRNWMALLLVITIALAFHQSAAAHGHIEVGDYELEIGFRVEPAYQGELNGLELHVTNHRTNEPVNGLEETLKAEIIFGSSKKELRIEPLGEEEGAYTANVIPTEVGDYTWRIFGMIEETPVDVSMTSAPDTFGSVESKEPLSFPNREASSATSGTAQTALIVGVIGIVLGLAGVVMATLSYRAARRKPV